MADTVTGPCGSWATQNDVEDGCDCGDLTVDDVMAKIPAASDLLYRMSGHQWPGACTVTILPDVICGSWQPLGYQLSSGRPSCACSDYGRCLWLPDPHITSIGEIQIDGQVLAPAAYRVDDMATLVRLDGYGWPTAQDDVADGQPGTWSITYTHGLTPPPSGVDAAVALACELAKACSADADDCVLPARAVTVSRRGVAYELQPEDLMTDGRTGIEAVDLFLHAVNPHQLAYGSAVRSPDIPSATVPGT